MMLSLILLLATQGPRFASSSCAAGQAWEYVLRGHDFDRSPRWRTTDDAPPLAPRVAVRSARAFLGRMKCEQPDEWELHRVSLQPIAGEPDVWVYIVEFLRLRVPKDAVIGSGSPSQVSVVVLLDGTPVAPSVKLWPPRR